MSIEGQLRSEMWILPEGFDGTKYLGVKAAEEIEQLRATVATLTEKNAQQTDSLHHWAVLWEHIEARLGESMLPNESNFDKMLLAAQPHQVTP